MTATRPRPSLLNIRSGSAADLEEVMRIMDRAFDPEFGRFSLDDVFGRCKRDQLIGKLGIDMPELFDVKCKYCDRADHRYANK